MGLIEKFHHVLFMKDSWNGIAVALYSYIVSSDGISQPYEGSLESIIDKYRDKGKILDVGCGPGYATRFIAKGLPNAEVIGVDLSEPMIKRARTIGKDQSNLSFQLADALNLPYADGEFDLIFSSGSIKLWPNQQQGVFEMSRVLRFGGTVIIVEVDRMCRPSTVNRIVSHWTNIPRFLHPLCSWSFLKFVASQGLVAETIHNLLVNAKFQDVTITQSVDYPAIVASGKK